MSKKPSGPRSTEDILREMESLSKGVGKPQPEDEDSGSVSGEGGGAFKSLLGFFVKVVPEEELQKQKPTASSPSPPSSNVPPPQMRTGPRVADLVAGEPAPTFDAPKPQTGDLFDIPFEDIYKEARITEAECSVEELETLLNNPAVANQPMSVKIIAVNLALSSKGIGPEVPIADAARRDRALDAYQQMLDGRAQQTEKNNMSLIQEITKEAEEYLKRKQAEMEALRAEIAEAKRQSVDFSLRRETEEKRLAELISPFLAGKPNPVTVGNQPDQESPDQSEP